MRDLGHQTVLPRPELRGEGTVTYRCASCGDPVEEPLFSDGNFVVESLPLHPNPETRTYHREHIGDPDGR